MAKHPCCRNEFRGIVSLRSAVLLTMALLAGVCIGALTYVARRPVAEAILAGLTGAGAAFTFFDRVIIDRP